jgi:ribonuclease E
MKDNTQRVIARVPVDVGTYLLNEKRELLVELESRHKIAVMLIPTPALDTPNYDIQRIRKDDSIEDKPSPSYHIAKEPIESEETPQEFAAKSSPEQPAVSGIKPTGPAPKAATHKKTAAPGKPGFLKRLIASLFGKKEEPKKGQVPRKGSQQRRPQQSKGRDSQGNRGGGRSRQPQRSRRTGGRQAQDSSNRQGRSSGKRPQARQDNRQKQAQDKSRQPESTAKPATSDDVQKEQQQKASPQSRGSRRGRRGGRRRSGQSGNPGNQGEVSGNTAEAGNPGSTQNTAGNAPQNDDNRGNRSATEVSDTRVNKTPDQPQANPGSGQSQQVNTADQKPVEPRPAPQTAPPPAPAANQPAGNQPAPVQTQTSSTDRPAPTSPQPAAAAPQAAPASSAPPANTDKQQATPGEPSTPKPEKINQEN